MTFVIDEDNYLAHYGILRKSGRYPWGSGETPSERSRSFFDHVSKLRAEGLSDTEIARGFGMTTTEFRNVNSIAKNAKKQADIGMAQRLKDKGYSNVAIGQRMGINESSVRSLLAPGQKDKADILQATTNVLKDNVDRKKYVDIGAGTEYDLGVSRDKLDTAVAVLKDQGYKLYYVKMPQLGTRNETTMKVLVPPGTEYKEVFRNRDKIQQIRDFSEDGGRSFLGLHEPLSVSSSRIAVKYKEEGGDKADGVIYVRPGVKDVSLGPKRYAQVRIAVDGTHYLKGMAVYNDDLPAGVDLMFNTNKSNTGNKLDAMKPMKDDPDNPFGSMVRQIVERDRNGHERVTSAMNIVGTKEGSGEEGSWDEWSRNLSSQFLSKQSSHLAQKQLDVTFQSHKDSLDEILSLTNPAVRKKLLKTFADEADSSAVHLKAAALPRQRTQVLLPMNSMKETEIYAPNFRDGERVALVRFPHGGTFEIPELTVNNRNPTAKRILGDAEDAVGIHHKVAQRLSGADFDGDTVLVIPNNDRKVKTTPPLEKLKGFDPQAAYPAYEGMKRMSPRTKQIEMGVVSNLITDMTIRGAGADDLARAVRHSMVVIDAEKHNLNYRQSAIDNGIAQLKAKYQGSARSGASTLISRANSDVRVLDRKPRPAALGGPIDKATGKKVFVDTGATYVNRKGHEVPKTIPSKKLAETDNAHTLSSGTPIEKVYADHSNRLKSLANKARLEYINTTTTPYSPSAKAAYSNEVASLNAKLRIALRNAPLERQAQVLANAVVNAKRQANPEMEASELKKIKSLALAEARTRTGAKKEPVSITQEEWNAIQAGAITNHKLSQILEHSDIEQVRKLATPKHKTLMTSSKTSLARTMLANGHTAADVADALGVSLTTLKNSLKEGS